MSQEVEFQILDWRTHEDEDVAVEEGQHIEAEQKYVVDLYGRTREDKTIYVKVTDFTPYFYVEIPLSWGNSTISKFIYTLKQQVYYKYRDSLLSYESIKRCKFVGFSNYKQFQFLRLVFKNHTGYRKFSYTLTKPIKNPAISRKPRKYQTYESNIEPFMRCMHKRDLEACGWVKIKKHRYEDTGNKPSICDINIETKWTNLEKVDDTHISKFVIASFDIECTSGDGSFPQAERDSDKVIQIGTTFNRYGEDDCFYKHIVTLGTCDPIPGVDVEHYQKEKDVLIAWTRMIERMNPDILTGYNIFGFDYKYLYNRSKKLGCYHKFSKLSRTRNFLTEFKEKQLSSSALGDNMLTYYDMIGRINIDLMKVIQKDYKLESYKLDYVASWFIRENIESIELGSLEPSDLDSLSSSDSNGTGDITVISTKSTYGLKVGQFISIYYNDGLTDNKYKDGKKFKILKLTKKSITISGSLDGEEMDTNLFKSFWCQAKDDVSPNDIFRLQEGSSKDRALIARYCIQDCVLCNKLMNKLQIVTNNIGMANVCNVPLSYLFLRGQGVKIFSLVSKKCRVENHLIPVVKKKYKPPEDPKDKPMSKLEKEMKKMGFDMTNEENDDDDEGYEGATVFPPDVGVHFEPIAVLDYASLYPRSMIHRNLSHECIVIDPDYDNLQGYIYRNVTYRSHSGKNVVCRYAQKKDGTMGIIPKILQDLLDARDRTKKAMKTETDPFKKNILDGLQLAYKITANSLYGQIGAPTSPIYYKDIAASTTATGREMLTFAKEFNEIIFPYLVGLIQKKKHKTFKEKMNELFDGKLLDFNISKEFIELLETSPDLVVKVTDARCVDEKRGITGKEDFIKWFKKQVVGILGDYKIEPKVIYGDSVVKDTPVIVKYPDGHVEIKRIDELGDEWKEYNNFKPYDKTSINKEQCSPNIQIWCNGEWTKVKRVIRHLTNKKIYRVKTQRGYVDVTEDHSLLNENCEQIKPLDCEIGTTKLLHSFPDIFEPVEMKTSLGRKKISGTTTCTDCDIEKQNTEYYKTKGKVYPVCKQCRKNSRDEKSGKAMSSIITREVPFQKDYIITKDEAWVWGFFFGDGSCGCYPGKWSNKYSWALNNNNKHYLTKAKNILEKCEPLKFKMLDTMKSSAVYKLVPNKSIKHMVNKYRSRFYDVDKNKIVPTEILNAELDVRKSFLEGYYCADGCKTRGMSIQSGKVQFACKGKSGAQSLIYLLKSIGITSLSVGQQKGKEEIYFVRSVNSTNDEVQSITLLRKLDNNEHVYDIETERGYFHAGVGDIVVKNTDSVFINFGVTDPTTGERQTDHAALARSIQLGILAGLVINKFMPYPHDLEYEKTFWPFIILTKKRYVGNLFEEDPDKFKQKSMGIVLKRRDNAQVVKIVCGGIVRSILNDKSIEKAIEFTRGALYDILCGKYPIEKFVITKTLKSEYADRTRIVHAVLADRMGERDPGNKPQSNDRIPYAYVVTKGDVKLQGDRVEHPEYIIENKLHLDYLFYITNQIMKPCVQFLALMLKKPEAVFNEFIVMEENRRKGKRPIEYMLNNIDKKKTNGFSIDDDFDSLKEIKAPKKSSKPKKEKKPKQRKKFVVKDLADSMDEIEYNEAKGGFTIDL